jgi:phage shock protein A
MWARFKRWLKSIFGGAISALEDPKLILEQNIRELNDQVPKMNEQIATVKANVMLLQKEAKRYDAEITDLTSKIRAGIQANREDIAQQYAMRLEEIKEAHVRTKEQLRLASASYDKALQIKKAFMREKDRKIREAKDALRAHERAKWQAKVADTLEKFETVGVDSTHDEMINRIQEQTAVNEARMELALDSVDSESMKIEEDARTLRAQELVKQFKLEMGVSETAPEETAPEIEISEAEKEQEAGEKTLGRQRTQNE